MGRCRHRLITYCAPLQEKCLACGYNFPLGPANDTPEVLVEVRAAELALTKPGAFVSNDAWSGFDAHKSNDDPPPWPECPDAWAGWLSREMLIGEQESNRD